MPKMNAECTDDMDLVYESGTLVNQNQTSFGEAVLWNLKK
jgi:hypothetical protein